MGLSVAISSLQESKELSRVPGNVSSYFLPDLSAKSPFKVEFKGFLLSLAFSTELHQIIIMVPHPLSNKQYSLQGHGFYISSCSQLRIALNVEGFIKRPLWNLIISHYLIAISILM